MAKKKIKELETKKKVKKEKQPLPKGAKKLINVWWIIAGTLLVLGITLSSLSWADII